MAADRALAPSLFESIVPRFSAQGLGLPMAIEMDHFRAALDGAINTAAPQERGCRINKYAIQSAHKIDNRLWVCVENISWVLRRERLLDVIRGNDRAGN